MSITLARFSQEVDVATGSMDVSYFAVFRSSDGRELRLPISQTASQELIAFMADKEKKAEVPISASLYSDPNDEMVSEEEEFSTEFGEEYNPETDQEEYEQESPDSEEEIPSL